MQLLGTTVRIAVLTFVAFLYGIMPAAAQTDADLEVFLQKFPISDGEPLDAPVHYYIDVWNYGPAAAENVVLTDVLPPGATFESTESEQCSYNNATRTFTCEFGTIDAISGYSVDLIIRTPSTPTTMTNTAVVSSTTTDLNPSNNSSSLTTNVVIFQLSDLAVTMSTSAASVKVHQAVTFTSTITNNGPSTATAVTWTAFPPFLADIVTLAPSQGVCATTDDELTCHLGPLTPGASATVTLTVKPQKDGLVLTFASVSGEDDPAFFDTDDSNNFASANVDADYPGNANPAFTTLERLDVPISSGVLYNACGDGEFIIVNGTVHQVMATSTNKKWFRTRLFTSYQDLNGVGLTSGTEYRVGGISKDKSAVYNGFFPRDYTTVDTFKLTPVGGGDSLLLHQNTHVTIRPDGTVTSTVDNARIDCK